MNDEERWKLKIIMITGKSYTSIFAIPKIDTRIPYKPKSRRRKGSKGSPDIATTIQPWETSTRQPRDNPVIAHPPSEHRTQSDSDYVSFLSLENWVPSWLLRDEPLPLDYYDPYIEEIGYEVGRKLLFPRYLFFENP